MGGELTEQEIRSYLREPGGVMPFNGDPKDLADVASWMYNYTTTEYDPHEVAYKEYEHEQWEQDPRAWSPLITLEELAKRPDPEIEWFCPGWIPVGSKTIVSAVPKTGKTILLFHILKAITEGGEFVGNKCHPSRVLYLTELTEVEFKSQCKEVKGLLGNPNFFVLLAEDTPAHIRTWEDTIEFAANMLKATKSKVLVVDTFGSLAKLPPNGENDAATIQNQINKLNVLFKQQRYLSVILTHHNRKVNENPKAHGSNLTVNSARGSSAFVGGGGHLIFMDAPNPYSTKRDFAFFGRYINGKTMTLDLTENGYVEVAGRTFGGKAI